MTGTLTSREGGHPRGLGPNWAGHLRPEPHLGVPTGTPFLEWRPTWTLDVGFMDEDHRGLVVLLNRLARDYGPRVGPDLFPVRCPEAPPLAEALAELDRRARAHFHREEEVMRVDGYPGLPEHKSEHDQLLAELSILGRGVRESGRQSLDAELLESLKDWLLGHMLEQDRELAEFLKRPGPPGEGGPGL